jgi:hypothetical protein
MVEFLNLNEGFSFAVFSYVTQRVIDFIIPATFGKSSYDSVLNFPTPDNDRFLRENIQMFYDRVPTHAFTLISSYYLGQLALRMLDGLLALVWKSPNLSIKVVMINLVYLKHVVKYNIVDLMIPSISTSFSVPISVSIIISPVHHGYFYLENPTKSFIVCLVSLVFQMTSKSKMISISERTYHNLAQMGTLEDTFDSVIDRMIREKIAMSGRALGGSSLDTATASQPLKSDSRDNG